MVRIWKMVVNNEHVKCRNNTIIERYGSLEKYKKL
jgi:hypothetical protein